MSLAMEHPSDRRLLGFLAISAALHALWLAVPLHTDTGMIDTPPPLVAHLLPRLDQPIEPARTEPARKSAVAARLLEHEVDAPTPAQPAIDLDSARASARAWAREAQPRTSLDAPKPLFTVETAIAHATVADVVVEAHGAAGEYVTKSRHSRCVTPTHIPHFLEGKTMLTQCEVRKG
jgi:hypothetical protein